ncbi:hypothetical protein [Burkholderia gladioli]|uniref:hypothetical protein n=1 Tax=Burkholderia gladioli TaxID=28095 RepID=UPI0016416911|nr:hypothetical protein [Burkholderia gladioli]
MILKGEVSCTDKVCGNCTSAAQVTIRELSGMIWCETGQAARRSGMMVFQAVYINPKRVACEDFRLRSEPLGSPPASQPPEEAAGAEVQIPTDVTDDAKQPAIASALSATEPEEPPFYMGDFDDGVRGVPPWELPDNREVSAARLADRKNPVQSQPTANRQDLADAFL